MAINIVPKSVDTELSELMRDVNSGQVQLLEFQSNWTCQTMKRRDNYGV
jgi:hypothetical protein